MSIFNPSTRVKKIILILVLTGAFINFLVTTIGASRGARYFSDDAYYYIIIARNYVEHGVPSFDTIHETNGFHPLWFAVLTVAFMLGLGHASLQVQYLTIVVIEQAIWLLTMLCLVLYGRKHRDNNRKFLFFVVLSCWFLFLPAHSLFTHGMETTLAALMLLLILRFYEERREVHFSALSGLLVLTRLDLYFFCVVPLFLLYALRSFDVEGLKGFFLKAVRILLIPSLAIAFVALTNYLRFGYPSPISGVIKSGFPFIPVFQPTMLLDGLLAALLTQNCNRLTAGLPLYLVIILLTTLIFTVLSHRNNVAGLLKNTLFAYSVAGSALFVNIVLFQKWSKGIDLWYLVVPLILAGVIISYAISGSVDSIKRVLERTETALRVPERLNLSKSPRTFSLLVMVPLLVIVGISATAIPYYSTYASSESSLESWMDTLEDDVVFASTDCGSIAFWSNKTFVNLDGLVNDYNYQEVIRDGGLNQYLHENGVDYILVSVWEEPQPQRLREPEKMYQTRIAPDVLEGNYATFDFYVYSYLYYTYSDIIHLSRSDEVFRSSVFMDGLVKSRFIVWRLH